MTPLKATLAATRTLARRANRHIPDFARMDLAVEVRWHLGLPTSGTAVLNARHYAE